MVLTAESPGVAVESSAADIHLRPAGLVSWGRNLVPFYLLFAPIYVTTLALAGSAHVWSITIAILLTMLGCALAAQRLSTAEVVLQPGGMLERGVLPTARFTPATFVASAVMLKLLDSDSLNFTPQLFLLDANDRTQLRLRGRFWSVEQMNTVIQHFGVPVVRLEDPITATELRATRGHQLYWHEQRPVLAAIVVVVAGGLACTALVGAAMHAIVG